MGRYKRHARTKTVVKPNFKITYTVSSEEKKKQEKDTTVVELVRDFTYSLKENGKFSNFIRYYTPFNKVLYDNTILLSRFRMRYGNYISIGKNIRLRKRALPTHPQLLYKSSLWKIGLVNELLRYNNETSIKKITENYNDYSREQILEDYAKHCVEKSGIKVYPNQLIFSLGFGLLFAIIGFLTFTFMLAALFGNIVALGYGLCVLWVLPHFSPLKR